MAVAERPAAREAQRALADDVTALVHGEAARDAAVAASRALFGQGELADLDPATLEAALREAPYVERRGRGGADRRRPAGRHRPGGLPRSAARRAVEEGGAYLNNERVTDVDAVVDGADWLFGRYAVLRRGKRTFGGRHPYLLKAADRWYDTRSDLDLGAMPGSGMVLHTTQGAPDASRPDPVVTHDEHPLGRLLGALGTASSWGLDRSDLLTHQRFDGVGRCG